MQFLLKNLSKARIYDILYNEFNCVQLEYTTNKQTFIFRDI